VSWDNLTDAQLAEMPDVALRNRVYLYAVVASDRKQQPDYPDVSQALDRAIAVWKQRT
jgi:hypothetical protein